MSPPPDEASVCVALEEEFGRLSAEAGEKWRVIEGKVEEKCEEVLRSKFDVLHRLFGLREEELSNVAEGGLRFKVRDRVRKLVLSPFSERLLESLPGAAVATVASSSSAPSADQDGGVVASSHTANDPIGALLEIRAAVVEPLVSRAATASEKRRTTRRPEQLGAAEAAKIEEMRESVQLWAPVRSALEGVLPRVRRLAELLKAEASAEAAARLASAVPATVGRAVCDWYFHRFSAELEQLDTWWNGASSALQRRPVLWNQLLEGEGLLVRRIDNGIEEIRAERSRYVVYATFGANRAEPSSGGEGGGQQITRSGEWPDDSIALLAQCINGMRRRLKPIRDSAAWRVMDAAKTLQKRLREQNDGRKRSPWERVSEDEGLNVFCDMLGIPSPSLADLASGGNLGRGTDPADSALAFMRIIDRIVAVSAELRDLPEAESVPDTGGLFYIFEEVMQGLAYLSEELLAVMDEPEEEHLRSWVREWSEWGNGIAGPRLESAMKTLPLKPDSALPPEDRVPRRRRLALMRGMQALLDKPDFRLWCLSSSHLTRSTDTVPSQPRTATSLQFEDDHGGLEVLSLDGPPEPPHVSPKNVAVPPPPSPTSGAHLPAPVAAAVLASAASPSGGIEGNARQHIGPARALPQPVSAPSLGNTVCSQREFQPTHVASESVETSSNCSALPCDGGNARQHDGSARVTSQTSPTPSLGGERCKGAATASAATTSAAPVKRSPDVGSAIMPSPPTSPAIVRRARSTTGSGCTDGQTRSSARRNSKKTDPTAVQASPSSASATPTPTFVCDAAVEAARVLACGRTRSSAEPRAASTASCTPRDSGYSSPAGLSRPVTPSWLEPPWPRLRAGDMNSPMKSLGLSGGFGARPDTPSTVCDDADLQPVAFSSSVAPRWKQVEGQFIPLRPSSSATRLAPLKAVGPRKAW